MQNDSIIAIAVAHAIQKRPELVQEDILKLMRRQTELVEENEGLRRRVAQLQVAGIMPGRR